MVIVLVGRVKAFVIETLILSILDKILVIINIPWIIVLCRVMLVVEPKQRMDKLGINSRHIEIGK